MNRNRRLLLVAAVLVALLTAASVAAWRTLAAPAPQGTRPSGPAGPDRPAAAAGESPVPGGPAFSMVSALLFKPEVREMSWAYENSAELYNPGPLAGYYVAPVSLPDGVVITRLIAYYYDASSDRDLDVQLWRFDGAGNWDYMANSASSGASGYGYAADDSIDFSVIDLRSFSYSIWVHLDKEPAESLRFTNVRIDYGYDANLPLVVSDR